MNRRDSLEVERYDWGYHHKILAASNSPPCQQTMVSIDKEPLKEESQQVEMSCQSTQLPIPATSRLMWANFTRIVRDWPPPTVLKTGRDDRWISTKKRRWDLTVYGNDCTKTRGVQRRKTMTTSISICCRRGMRKQHQHRGIAHSNEQVRCRGK